MILEVMVCSSAPHAPPITLRAFSGVWEICVFGKVFGVIYQRVSKPDASLQTLFFSFSEMVCTRVLNST